MDAALLVFFPRDPWSSLCLGGSGQAGGDPGSKPSLAPFGSIWPACGHALTTGLHEQPLAPSPVADWKRNGPGQGAARQGDEREPVFWKGPQRKQQNPNPATKYIPFTENGVSCSPARGSSTKKLFTAQGTAPCSRTPCSLSSISWQHGFVLIFFFRIAESSLVLTK